jgi:Ulp1 family protease
LPEVDSDDIFPGYSMDKVEFIVLNMRRNDQDFVVQDKSVCIGDVRTVFQYRSWLNDEAISSYMQLIGDRDPCKVYAFNTYFYPMLS